MHEAGHALGLVSDDAPYRSPKYEGHCKYEKCTMWYAENGVTRFHPEAVSNPGCRAALRGLDLGYRAMMNRWDFPVKTRWDPEKP
jgi:hypothetical protein